MLVAHVGISKKYKYTFRTELKAGEAQFFSFDRER